MTAAAMLAARRAIGTMGSDVADISPLEHAAMAPSIVGISTGVCDSIGELAGLVLESVLNKLAGLCELTEGGDARAHALAGEVQSRVFVLGEMLIALRKAGCAFEEAAAAASAPKVRRPELQAS